jgi:hypothetical protein
MVGWSWQMLIEIVGSESQEKVAHPGSYRKMWTADWRLPRSKLAPEELGSRRFVVADLEQQQVLAELYELRGRRKFWI